MTSAVYLLSCKSPDKFENFNYFILSPLIKQGVLNGNISQSLSRLNIPLKKRGTCFTHCFGPEAAILTCHRKERTVASSVKHCIKDAKVKFDMQPSQISVKSVTLGYVLFLISSLSWFTAVTPS